MKKRRLAYIAIALFSLRIVTNPLLCNAEIPLVDAAGEIPAPIAADQQHMSTLIDFATKAVASTVGIVAYPVVRGFETYLTCHGRLCTLDRVFITLLSQRRFGCWVFPDSPAHFIGLTMTSEYYFDLNTSRYQVTSSATPEEDVPDWAGRASSLDPMVILAQVFSSTDRLPLPNQDGVISIAHVALAGDHWRVSLRSPSADTYYYDSGFTIPLNAISAS